MAVDLDIRIVRVDRVRDGEVVGQAVIVTGSASVPTPEGFWPVVIVNPPELVPDGLGGFRSDPDEAIREVVRQAIEGT